MTAAMALRHGGSEQTSPQVVPCRTGSGGAGSCPSARPFSEIRVFRRSSLRRARGCAPDAFRHLPVGSVAGRGPSPRGTVTGGSFDITDPFPEKTIGDAIVCPEQRESNLGDCAACWSTDRPIAFIRH